MDLTKVQEELACKTQEKNVQEVHGNSLKIFVKNKPVSHVNKSLNMSLFEEHRERKSIHLYEK